MKDKIVEGMSLAEETEWRVNKINREGYSEIIDPSPKQYYSNSCPRYIPLALQDQYYKLGRAVHSSYRYFPAKTTGQD